MTTSDGPARVGGFLGEVLLHDVSGDADGEPIRLAVHSETDGAAGVDLSLDAAGQLCLELAALIKTIRDRRVRSRTAPREAGRP